MARPVRILLIADSHLGFDLPVRPRVSRRRRGHDFLANYQAALRTALEEEVDLVVHGGDVFHRSQVAPSLAFQAFQPLVRLADRGVPVFLVPGNHERSRLPHRRFLSHERVHVFDRPRTFTVPVRGTPVALAGFPFVRRDVGGRFPELLERTGWREAPGSLRLLCMHQCVEGATVGPAGFIFRRGSDVVAGRDLPAGFAAVLAGHIHRHQVLTRDVEGRRLAAPVLYPGSIERTSLAERGESKGFLVVHGGPRIEWEFRGLPARPMIVRDLDLADLDRGAVESAVRAVVAASPPDAVLRIRMTGTNRDPSLPSSARVRSFAPPTMNVDLRPVARTPVRREPRRGGPRHAASRPDLPSEARLQLELRREP